MVNFGKFFKKFAAVAVQVAPIALMSIGQPPELATAIVTGITTAATMVGATNTEKAAKAAQIAQASIKAMNAIAVQHGGAPLVDETITDDVLANAIKLTYDMTKMAHTASGTPMPVAAPGA